jgi:uncharacterized protein (TIGR02466 family)
MEFSGFSVQNLFPTPLITASLPVQTVAELKAQLVPMLLKKSETMPTAYITNVGGWQSDTKILEWGGAPVQKIVSALKDVIKQVTMDLHNPKFELTTDWKVYGWANINRKGHFNTVHTHPGSFWSAIYYVQVDPEEAETGGELEIRDPRGTLPITYRPQLRIKMEEYHSCGGHVVHKPKEGEYLLFPSWLPHAVNPYTGDGVRISLALNFSV